MELTQKIAPRGSSRRRWARALASAAGYRRTRTRPTEERKKLERSWARHDQHSLSEYLVTGYQNPRINAQSILTRHVLIRELFGSEFEELMREEFAFCTEANETIRRRANELGVKMGAYLDPTKRSAVKSVSEAISHWEGTYEQCWAEALKGRSAGRLKVLELACGSANDYRFFSSYGIANFLEYTGVDLNKDNIRNARSRFPGVLFEVRDILDLPDKNRSYDYIIASDIFEHLSPSAMEQAINEACRLVRRGLVINFFSMSDIPEHDVRARGSYHWNVLSSSRVRERLERDFGSVTSTHIRTFLRDEFGYQHAYNKKAWTVTAMRRGA